MPITINDLDNGLGNIILGSGEITSEEYCEVLLKHLSQPVDKMKKYIYSISDFTAITDVTVTLEDVRMIAQKSLEIAKINPDVTVVISTSEKISTLLAEVWEIIVNESSWNVNLFQTREELDKWLQETINKKYLKYSCSFN